uniref:Uncharacterized protein n=1 Tax=Rhizophora mucronata TaxID=61149 RepID=A0A2P2J3T2_RHIMU
MMMMCQILCLVRRLKLLLKMVTLTLNWVVTVILHFYCYFAFLSSLHLSPYLLICFHFINPHSSNPAPMAGGFPCSSKQIHDSVVFDGWHTETNQNMFSRV